MRGAALMLLLSIPAQAQFLFGDPGWPHPADLGNINAGDAGITNATITNLIVTGSTSIDGGVGLQPGSDAGLNNLTLTGGLSGQDAGLNSLTLTGPLTGRDAGFNAMTLTGPVTGLGWRTDSSGQIIGNSSIFGGGNNSIGISGNWNVTGGASNVYTNQNGEASGRHALEVSSNSATWTRTDTYLFDVQNNGAEAFGIVPGGGAYFPPKTLPTCSSAIEWNAVADSASGAATGNASRLCVCRSNGSSSYAWYNMFSTTPAVGGTTTTCPN